MGLLLFALPHAGAAPVTNVAPGTARMAARLEQLNQKADPMANPFRNVERVSILRARLAAAQGPEALLAMRANLAFELLNAGEPEEALRHLDACFDLIREQPRNVHTRTITELHLLVAICNLRLGEQENCLAFHGSESCLLPIRPAAVHKQQRGSRAAIAKLTDILNRNSSGSLQARWLLNLAYMTVNEYPEKVPAQWLIPPQVFAPEHPLPRFPNIAAEVGLDQDGLAGGVVAEDFDNDGDLDLMVSEWGVRDPLHLYRNNGDGTFSERSAEAGLTGLTGGLNMVQADYDNDGFVDVLVLRGAWMGAAGRYPNSLLRNRGDGTFEDVTEAAGLLSFFPTQTATWFDYDNDGRIDLFIGNESSRNERHPCELYRNNGNGTFTECAVPAGVAVVGFVKGVTSGDFNNDGRPDLYLSVRGGTNILFRNEGPAVPGNPSGTWRFRDVTARAGVGEPIISFPTWFFDCDNDGWPDLFVSGYGIRDVGDVAADHLGLPTPAERARLYRNNGDGTFADVSKSAGVFKVLHAMGCNFGDLDNDGWLDFYLGTGDPSIGTIIPNRMFRNDGGRRFQDVTTAGGFGHLQKGHAVVFADLDQDGDQDVYESIGGAYSGDVYRNALFENPGTTNHWIGLKLEGVQSNRSAIGARIKVKARTAADERQIFKTVNSGGSFGANPLRQQLGVGAATNAFVEVFWPTTGKTQVFENLAAGRFYHIRETEPKAVRIDLKPFKLGAHTQAPRN